MPRRCMSCSDCSSLHDPSRSASRALCPPIYAATRTHNDPKMPPISDLLRLTAPPSLRRAFHPGRHLRSTQHPPVPAATQHVQQAVAEQKKHPSAVSHPALRNTRPNRANDKALYLTFFGLLFGVGPLVYWYWQYRQDHMRRKKEQMLADIRARYQAGG